MGIEKRVRQKAVEETLILVIGKQINENVLKELLMVNSPHLSSSVIQIMCRAGTDETKTLLYWLREFRDLHNPIMNEHEWLRLKRENIGERIHYTIRKYIKDNIQFEDLFEYLHELYIESIEIRRGLIAEIRISYPKSVDDLVFCFSQNNISISRRTISEEHFRYAEQMEIEDFAPLTNSLPQELKDKYLYKLYYYQYWLHLFRDLCLSFVDFPSYSPVFTIEKVLLLNQTNYFDQISCPNSRFRRLASYALKELPETNYMILRGFDTFTKESLWKSILQSHDWYTDTPLEKYYEHISSKALQALLVLGDSEALYLFKDICEYYDSFESGVPADASRVNSRFLKEKFDPLKDNSDVQIGHRWEIICRKIAKHKYRDVQLHPKLPNGMIPDISVNYDMRFSKEKLVKTKCIIECKKSDSFINQSLPPNRQRVVSEYNNTVTKKYLPYCERLEFWIFEDNGIIKRRKINNRKVVVRYATDFLSESSLPVELIKEIQDLFLFKNQIYKEEMKKIAEDSVLKAKKSIYELHLKYFSPKS